MYHLEKKVSVCTYIGTYFVNKKIVYFYLVSFNLVVLSVKWYKLFEGSLWYLVINGKYKHKIRYNIVY